MIAYIARRLLFLPVILFGVTALIFVMLGALTPGQRAALYITSLPKNPNDVARVIALYGLDEPLPRQYVRWLGRLAHGDLGFSATGKEPVADVIRHHAPATLELALWAFLPIVWVGIRLGVFAAARHNQAPDQALRVFSTVGTTVPYFLVALVALMVFAAWLGWLPPGDRLSAQYQLLVDGPTWHAVTGMYTVDSLLNARPDVFVDAVRHLVLPVLTLAVVSWALLLRVTRSSMLENLRQDYVRTAQAKGLSRHAVIHKHAWANARLPVVTIVAWTLMGLIGGQAMVESVFSFPGLGNRFIQAAVNLDVVTTVGLTLLAAVILIVGNLVTDVLYAYLDPRVRLG